MIAHLKFSRIVVVVVHIPLAKPMTSGDDAVPHRHLGGVGIFIANQRRTCILIGMHHGNFQVTQVSFFSLFGLPVSSRVGIKWCCGSK